MAEPHPAIAAADQLAAALDTLNATPEQASFLAGAMAALRSTEPRTK
ncbi:hypothetical protein [Prescottella equi]